MTPHVSKLERTLSPLLLSLLIGILALYHFQGGIYDDAFITYRYTANVVAGQGLVYNAGQMVLGTTTPGYALLLVPFALVFGADNLPLISLSINLLLLTAVFLLYYSIAWQIFKRPFAGVVAVFLLLLSYYTYEASTGGMEMPFFHLLVTSAFLALLHKRWYLAAGLITILPLVRPEGVFVVGLVTLWFGWLVYRKELTLREALRPTVLLYVGGALYATVLLLSYGTILPQSIQAKSAGLYTADESGTVRRMAVFVGEYFSEYIYPTLGIAEDIYEHDSVWILAGIGFAMIALGAVWLIRQRREFWLLPALLLLMMAFFATSDTLLFDWYFGLFHPYYTICIFTGMYFGVRLLLTPLDRMPVIRNAFIVFMALVVFIVPIGKLIGWYSNDWAYPTYPYIQWSQTRINAFYSVSHAIADKLPAGTVIAAPEIGVPGFLMRDYQILDTAGLVSPEALEYFPIPQEQRASPGAVPIQMMPDYRPDMLLTMEIFGRNGILADEWFLDNYTAVVTCPNVSTIHSQGLYLFSRNDFAAGMALADESIPCSTFE